MIQGSIRDLGTTAAALTGGAHPINGSIRLKAAIGNGGIVYVGNSSSVTAGADAAFDGFPLSAGNEVVLAAGSFPTTNSIWLIGSAGTQVVYYLLDTQVSDDFFGYSTDFSQSIDSGLIPEIL